MLMSRLAPYLMNQLNRLHEDANRLFGELAADAPWPALAYSYPPVNVWEDQEHVYCEAELPGMQLDKINIYVTEGDQLTVEGERQPFDGQGTWHRRERGFGRFSRTFTLPVPVDADKVEARYEQGVLRITLPKSEAARPRRITVKAD